MTSRLLSAGDADQAAALLRATGDQLRADSLALPAPMAAELTNEAALLHSLADEAQVDIARAARASSYDHSRKSRQRGRASTGGAVQLRWADRDERSDAALVLEEWELVALTRHATTARSLRPSSVGSVVSSAVAAEIAHAVGGHHVHHDFFSEAARHGGIRVERA